MLDYKSYIQKQNDWYRREVPEKYRSVDPRKVVKRSLKTQDRAIALVRATALNTRLTAYWESLLESDSNHSSDRFRAAVGMASIHGFSYIPYSDVMELPAQEFVERAAKLAETGMNTRKNFQALFGTATADRIRIADLLQEYEKIARQELMNKTADQLRTWRNGRKRAIENWQKVNPNCHYLDEIDQHHTLAFKDWWLDRVEEEDLRPSSANKDHQFLAKMHRVVCSHYRIDHIKPFDGTRLPPEEEPEKFPFSRAWVQDTLLPGIAAMNLEARAIVYIVASTGARPSEIARIAPDALFVDAETPYLEIRATHKKKLKTRYSTRTIPLCGSALAGAKILKRLTDRTYETNSSSLSGTVNSFLTENSLRETPDHSFYSLRHTFQDGLTALELPDRWQTELMGHKFKGVKYGNGPSLEHKRKVMEKLCFREP